MAARTWKELEAQGVKRCCAVFTSGRRCTRRADADGSWCPRHRRVMDRVKEWNREAVLASLAPQQDGEDE